ncbi:MAG: RNA 2',3'-cyclic phosphodiesterase [Bryobacterales bacterium]|nr:RNA 2',3'-cyclic phosphodiesterase [Bryobacterales bacterium]
MRLFVGLDIPAPVTSSLERLVNQLRPTARINWSPTANLHITIKFIGEWPGQRLDEMRQVLGAIPRPGACEIEVRGLGWFPNPHRPKVFFAAVQVPAGLIELASAADRATAGLGVPLETRPYSPHLTLGRIKAGAEVNGLRQAVAVMPEPQLGRFTAERFFLYQSELLPTGSIYHKLAEFPLT